MILGVVGLLCAWCLLSARQLYKATQSLIYGLRRGRSVVDTAADCREFASSFEATAEQLAGLPPLIGPWSVFRGTLIIPEVPSRPVLSTLQPDHVFDLRLLRSAGLRPRYHAAMPGMLVGAGLLFTFLGLAVALSVAGGVVAGGDPVQSRQGLHQLLDAASFKFVTSLAGLLLSIAYTGFRNYRIRLVEQALDGFTAALDRQMPLVTPAFLQHEANEALRAQSAALDTFGNQLAVNIGQAFDNAFDKRLGEHIAPLTEAMQALANRTDAQNEDAVRQMLQAFTDQLSGGTREHLAGVTDNLAALGARLEELQSGLGDASVLMAQSAEAMAARMGEGAEAALSRISDEMGGLMEALRAVTEQTREAGAEAAQTLDARIERAAVGFETAATRMTETFARAAENTGDALARGAAEAADGLHTKAVEIRGMLENTGQSLSRQAGAFAATAEALAARVGELDRATREAVAPLAAGAADLRQVAASAQATTVTLHTVANSLGTAVEQMSGAAQRLAAAQAGAAKLSQDLAGAAQRFEGVDRSLAGTISALSGALDEFRRKTQEFVANTDGNLAKEATQVSAMIKGLDETLEDFGLRRQ
jgi:hypothetical protein